MRNAIKSVLLSLALAGTSFAQQYQAVMIPVSNAPSSDVQALDNNGNVIGGGWAFINGQTFVDTNSNPSLWFLNANHIAMNNRYELVTTNFLPFGFGYTVIDYFSAGTGIQNQLFSSYNNPGGHRAYDINDNGVVVGATYNHAVAWVRGVSPALPIDIAPLAGLSNFNSSYATSINDQNEILVVENGPVNIRLMKLVPNLQSGTLNATELVSLSNIAQIAFGGGGDPKINNKGDVLYSTYLTYIPGPGSYTEPHLIIHGTDSDLQLNGGLLDRANDINNLGTVVGIASPSQQNSGAAKLDIVNGQPVVTSLNSVTQGLTSGCNLTEAVKINDRGQIVALANCYSGYYPYQTSIVRVFLLTPI